ncbi:MAG: nucleoside hydrolase [Planctomycetaceae bacterium]|nr:nucleoside hydrolase [Planctomycetaceae bacterium]
MNTNHAPVDANKKNVPERKVHIRFYWLHCCFTLLFLPQIVVAEKPVPILLDTDISSDCDDAGALAVLHALADQGKANILAVVTNIKCPANASAAAVDGINTYYGRGEIPIGTDKDGVRFRPIGPSSFTAALRDEFRHNTPSDNECPDAIDVCRKVLASQPDHSVVYCSVGALSNMEDLLRSEPDQHSSLTGEELIKKKVRLTVIMGGGFPRTTSPETNLWLDPTAAVTVANHWPGQIIWQGYEVGRAIISGAELKKTASNNPVRRAYELRPFHGGKAIDQGKPSHDQAAVLLAVLGTQPEYWTVISNGRVVINSDGHSVWNTDRKRSHRYVKIKGDPQKLVDVIEKLMSQVPARL